MKLVEIEPGRWRVERKSSPVARSALPAPHLISDIMPETEQVDGKFYTSKSAFRRVGRRLGLTEVGNEKFKPKQRPSELPEAKTARRQSLRKALQRVKGV